MNRLLFVAFATALPMCPAQADTVTRYSFAPTTAADVKLSGLDFQFTDAGQIVGGSVTCIARGEKSVNKKINVDFFIFDDSGTGAFYAVPSVRNQPVSDTSDAYCGSGGQVIANPHRSPKSMKVKITNSDTGEFTEVDLKLVSSTEPHKTKKKP